MSAPILLRQKSVIAWLVMSVFILVVGFPEAAKTLPPPPQPDLTAASGGLKAPSQELRGPRKELKGGGQGLALQETKTQVKIELPGDVLFDFDKWEIRPDAEPMVRKVAEIIKQYPRARVSIDGHTDAKGSDAYNLQLSEKRAASVKEWLVENGGVDGKRIKTKGWGEAKPIASNTNLDGSDNPEGRQKNRRVEIIVRK